MATQHTPRSILDRFFEAERQFTTAPDNKKDFGLVAETIDDKCALEQASGLPYPGMYRGPKGMLEWMSDANKWFSSIDVQHPVIFESAETTQLLIKSTVHFRIRATGEEVAYPFIQTVSVDLEKGTITEMTPWYWDQYDLNKRLGFDPNAGKQ